MNKLLAVAAVLAAGYNDAQVEPIRQLLIDCSKIDREPDPTADPTTAELPQIDSILSTDHHIGD